MDPVNGFVSQWLSESNSSSSTSIGQDLTCCCHYDPSEDDAAEPQLHDLGFALKKLSMMKCQMKKWQLERLRLESQTRSLKIALQFYGGNVNETLKPDPLILHFRKENCKLQKCRDELMDELKNLNQMLKGKESERKAVEEFDEQLREKLEIIGQEHSQEKKKLQETIENLQLQLQDKKESCTALGRLHTKLHDFMKNGKKSAGDQQVTCILERSIETLVELTKSCKELKKENECLLTEVETLKKEIKEDVRDWKSIENGNALNNLSPGELSNLYESINIYEHLVTEMLQELKKKENIIVAFQKEVFGEKFLNIELELTSQTNKNEPKEEEMKDTDKLLKPLKESLEKISKVLKEEKHASESWKLEVVKLRERYEKLHWPSDNYPKLELASITKEFEQLRDDKEKLMLELETFKIEHSEMAKSLNKLSADQEAIMKERGILVQNLECVKYKEETVRKELEVSYQQIGELRSNLASISANKEKLEREVGDFKWQLYKIKKDLEIEAAAKKELQLKIESSAVNSNATNDSTSDELSELKVQYQTLEDSKNELIVQLTDSKNENKDLSSENIMLQTEIQKLKSEIEHINAKPPPIRKSKSEKKSPLTIFKGRPDEPEYDSLTQMQKLKFEKDSKINEFMYVIEKLKGKMEIQISAIKYVEQLLSLPNELTPKKRLKVSELSLEQYFQREWSMPEINELFITSQKLSHMIIKVEQNLRNCKTCREVKGNKKKEAEGECFFDKNTEISVHLDHKPLLI